MKNIWITVVIIIVVVGGYFVWYKESAEVSTKLIKIGVIAPLTGIIADYGEEMKKGIEAVPHEQTVLVYEDDKCDPKEAVSAFKKLVDFEKIHFIIGPACGSPQEAIAPLVKDNDVVVIVPAAASNTLFDQSGGKIYNIQYALEDESKFLAQKIFALGYKKVALITYQNAFSKIHEEVFKKEYKGQIVKQISFATDSSDLSSELLKLKGVEYDAIFSTDISFFFAQGLKKMKELKITQPVFSQYAVELPAVRSLVEDVIYSFPSDIEQGKGAIYGLSREAASLLVAKAVVCKGESMCVKNAFETSEEFNVYGVKERPLMLKRIHNGQPENYAQEQL